MERVGEMGGGGDGEMGGGGGGDEGESGGGDGGGGSDFRDVPGGRVLIVRRE